MHIFAVGTVWDNLGQLGTSVFNFSFDIICMCTISHHTVHYTAFEAIILEFRCAVHTVNVPSNARYWEINVSKTLTNASVFLGW